MLRRLALTLTALLAAPACTSAPPSPAALRSADLADAAAAAETEMRRQGMPGMVLVVMQGDRIALARGYGVESSARPDPITPASLVMYNSLSKQFVAAAVMQLAEAGRLSVDDPVARHLPDWSHVPPALRIRHLLSHTSGMRDAHVQPELGALFDRPGTGWDEFAAATRETPSDWAPGTRWSYGNINYLMLQLIVERMVGHPLETALSDLLFRPLGLSSVRLCPTAPGGTPGEARGHVLRNGALAGHDPEPVHLFAGAGGLCGTTLDLARWTRALATGRAVSRSSFEQMSEAAPLADGGTADYGFALSLVRPDGVRRIGHGGYGGGFSAQAAYYPDSDLTTVVVGNRFLMPESIERKLVRRLLALPAPAYHEVPLTAEQRSNFAGSFDVGVHGWHPSIEEREGRLWFVLPGPPISFPLAYVGGDTLAETGNADGYRLVFSPDRRTVRLLGMGLMTWYGTRVPAAAAPTPQSADSATSGSR